MPDEWTNAWAGAGGKSEWEHAWGGASTTNPWTHAWKTVAQGAEKVVSPISNALDAQRFYAAKLAGAGNTTDEQLANERKALGLEGAYKAMPHFLQGATDLALQTATDPLTYETLFAGPAVKALGAGAKALARSTALGRAAEDYFSWGGKVARRSDIQGRSGEDVRDLARGAWQKGSRAGSAFSKGLQRRVDAAFHGLSDEEAQQVGKALNGDIPVESLDPKLQEAARKARATTALAHRIQSSIAQRQTFENLSHSLNVSPEAKQTLHKAFFAGGQVPGELEDVYKSMAAHVKEAAPHRENYLPGIHRADLENAPAYKMNVAEYRDPRLQQREELKGFSGQQVREGFESMSKNVGRQVQGKVIREAMGPLLQDEDVKALFDLTLGARGEARGDVQKILDGLKKVTNFPRAGIVSMTPRHAVNILDLLAANAGPKTVQRALQIFAKIAPAAVKGDWKTYARLTKGGADMGAVGGEFIERRPFFQNKIAQSVGLASWARWMNGITWAMDDAAKIARAEDLVAKGVDPLIAGGRAAHELVDYARPSKFGEHLRYIAPFATFRSAIPGAVLGSIARNPARAAALSRATSGAFYGSEPKTPWGTLTAYNPTADIGRGMDLLDPAHRFDYARGTLGTPVKTALDLVGLEPPGPAGGPRHEYWNYGEKVQPFKDKHGRWHLGVAAEYPISSLPLGPAALDLSNIGAFGSQGPGNEALRQIFGVGLR